jgi:murein DD-endopeptidase MepM/ murein hydrolase activator NlpD
MPEVTALQEFGNQIAILFDDGTKKLAYPTTGGFWLISGTTTPSPTTWQWPLALTPAPHTSQEWGGGGAGTHTGVDLVFSGIAGDPIYAIADSTVVDQGITTGNGNIIKLQASDGSYYAFYHMSAFNGLANGATVSVGDVIGFVGDTGTNVDPPGADHMHFVTSDTGWAGLQANAPATINPKSYMSTRGVPYPWPS